jgi:hypothetical protein
MALKHLELSEMAGLTAAWVGAHRPLLQGIQQVAPWLAQLDAVHARVVKAQPTRTTELDQELAALVEQQNRLDDLHDDLVRATALGLEAEQFFCRGMTPAQPERAVLCERALAMLLPQGLTIVNALYIAEAGHAARTRELLASEAWLRDLLASIPTSGGSSLQTVVETWCSLGEQLGLLEEKKALVQARIAGAVQVPRSEMLAARNAWLALVNMILGLFPMVEGHEEAIHTLSSPVLRTAEIAGKRYASRGGQENEENAPVVQPGTPTTPTQPGGPVAPTPVEPGLPGARPFA